MTNRALATAAFALGALLAGTAQADGGGGRPCREDVQKFCANVERGDGRIVECLKAHESELSDSCRAEGDKLKAHWEAFKAACGKDADALCKDADPGPRAMHACLVAHKSKLSASCIAFGKQMREERGERHHWHGRGGPDSDTTAPATTTAPAQQ